MRKTRIPTQLAKNASKMHKLVGKLLTCNESPYKNYEIRQEYHVTMVNPDYICNREKFDWVILGLKVVIEVHGEQHYGPVCFGGITIDEAKRNFLKRVHLDSIKQEAAERAMWAYVVVKYDETDLTLDKLVNRITRALEHVPNGIYEQEKTKAKIQNRGFQISKRETRYRWPTRKIQSRKFSDLNYKKDGK